MAFLIGPVVALLGLLILFFVLRTRAKTRTSLYTARRTLLQARTAERRDRALGGTIAGAIPAVAPTAPAQASAAAVADLAPTVAAPGAPAPAAPAAPGEQAWEQSPTRAQPGPPPPPPPLEAQPGGPVPDQPEAWPPASFPPAAAPVPPPVPEPAMPEPAMPEPAMPAAAAAAAPVDWPSSSAQVEAPMAAPGEEQVPVEPSMPAAEAPWAAEPNPAAEGFPAAPAYSPAPPAYEPAAAGAETQVMPPGPDAPPALEPAAAGGRSMQSWSIVGQGGEEIPADSLGVGGTARAEAAGKGEEKPAKRGRWDVIPHSRHKHEEVNLLMGQEAPKETVGMTLLSYAGLVGALVVVLLGVLLMVATTR